MEKTKTGSDQSTHMRLKTVFFLALLTGLSVIMAESLAKVVVYYGLGIRESDYSRYYREDPYLTLLTWVEKYDVHPYFGYENESIRQFEHFRESLTEGDFVIGVLGGSVAEIFGNYAISEPKLLQDLKTVIPGLDNKQIRIANLAMGGAKQPQQFFIAAYFLDNLDLVINIDGLNDALPTNFLPVYPLDFPLLSLRLYHRTDKGKVIAGLGRAGVWTYRTINSFPSDVPLLSYSSVYFAFWYAAHGRLYNLIQLLEHWYLSLAVDAQRLPGGSAADWKWIQDERVKIWKRYTILQSSLGSRSGKPAFFFLQPNQYLKNSKPLSDEEKRTAFVESWSEGNHERMMRLKSQVDPLRQSGVPIVDLTDVFKDRRETIYTDTCCHFNSLGNEIMGKEIVRAISRYYAEKR